MKTQDYLDAIKQRHGLTSDYQLGKKMQWSVSRVSSYRNGKTQFDDAACLAVAEALGMNALEVIADIHAERAKEPTVQEFWKEAAKVARAGFLAGFVFFMGSMTYAPSPTVDAAQSVYYVK